MKHIIVLILLLFKTYSFSAQPATDSLWQKVRKARKNRLPKTEALLLDSISKVALNNQRYAEYTRAMCEKIYTKSQRGDSRYVERIFALEKAMNGIPDIAMPLFTVVLAQWYWEYFDRFKNNYLSRSVNDTIHEQDFTTWPLQKIFWKIDSLYQSLFTAAPSLLQQPIDKFMDFLDPGTLPRNRRPTLYDFLLWEAIAFYTCVEQVAAMPQDTFGISAVSDAFGPLDTFLEYSPSAHNKKSPHYKALMLLKTALRHYKNSNNAAALIDADLHRLTFVHSVARGKDLDKIFITRLKQLLNQYGKSELTAMVRFRLAKAWHEKEHYTKAYTIAQQGLSSIEDSLTRSCYQALISQITSKSLYLNSEKIITPDPWELKLSYRNISTVYFRIVREDYQKFIKINHDRDSSYDSAWIARVIDNPPIHEWRQTLTNNNDFKEYHITLPMPQLTRGCYRIFASWEPDFQTSSYVSHHFIHVQSLMVIHQNELGNSGIVVDARSGEPVNGAQVNIYNTINSLFEPVKQVFTNKNGRFNIIEIPDGGYELRVQDGKEYEIMNHQTVEDSYRSLSKNERSLFFIDRSIYRPGQTIYFKGICVAIDHFTDTYQVLPGRKVKVTFNDTQNKAIESQILSTNSFGCFSGTFTAPSNGLMGRMSLSAKEHKELSYITSDDLKGSVSFRIEEYKRPTFTCYIDKPDTLSRLNDSVILHGHAIAYTQNPIVGARVKYKVNRTVKSWPWWKQCSISTPHRESKLVSQGKTLTGNDGSFTIPFYASPDTSLSREYNPAFNFSIFVEVTAGDGETRTKHSNVTLGYAVHKTQMDLVSSPIENEPFQITLQTSTLDGIPVVSSGIIKVFRIKEPTQPIRTSYGQKRYYPFDTNTSSMDIFTQPWQQWPRDRLVVEKQYNTAKSDHYHFTLKSGLFMIESISEDFHGTPVTSYLPVAILPRKGKKVFPVKLPSYTHQSSRTAEVGDTVNFCWGTGYPRGRAYVEIVHKGSVVKKYWTAPRATFHTFSVPVEEKHRGNFSANITFVKENRVYFNTFNVTVPWSNKEIACSLSTFRSLLSPGEKETWTVTLKGKNDSLDDAEAVVTMYDHSLDQLYKHHWRDFSFFRTEWNNKNIDHDQLTSVFFPWKSSWNTRYRYPRRTYYSVPSLIDKYIWNKDYNPRYGGGYNGRLSLLGGLMGYGEGVGSLNLKERGGLKAVNNVRLDTIPVRKNLNETAFFIPHLEMDSNNRVSFNFTVPEALTKWKMMFFAHGKNCENGGLSAYTVTSKELMIHPNAPRFLREGDTLHFTARVSNKSDSAFSVTADCELKDFSSGQTVDSLFGLSQSTVTKHVPANQSRTVLWKLSIPRSSKPIRYTLRARTAKRSDGVTGVLPVLSSRILLTESVPLTSNGPGKKTYTLKKIEQIRSSKTLEPLLLNVQITSNPAWCALRSLPYLLEYPYRCSEQVFNRYYGNALASLIIKENPRINEVLEQWDQSDEALISPIEKNEAFKAILLEETPWVYEGKKGTDILQQLAHLLDSSTIALNMESSLNLLKKRQLSSGAWAWFRKGPNPYITMYIVAGFGKLMTMGCRIDRSVINKAIDYLDKWIVGCYIKKDRNKTPYHRIHFYLYARSMHLERKRIDSKTQTAIDYYLNALESTWMDCGSLLNEGQAALALYRYGREATAQAIMQSLQERSRYSEETGRYWKYSNTSWWWYHAPIETQAVLIEAFDEILDDSTIVEQCKLWLLNQKRARSWKTTKATADAVYALLCRGDTWLDNQHLTTVKVGSIDCTPDSAEGGTGFYEKIFSADKITPDLSSIILENKSKGISWGGVHFQYIDAIDSITQHGSELSLQKQLYINNFTDEGTVLVPVKGPVKVGDRLTVRLRVTLEHDMEFVHCKDLRASGLEPVSVLSDYNYKRGCRYYQTTKDAATHFFFDYLRKGTHVLEYQVFAAHEGIYQNGIAQIQCMYAPEFNSHSAGKTIAIVQ